MRRTAGRAVKWLAGVAVVISSSARASGNEHIIDDAAVETAGVCHLESWISLSGHHRGLLNLSPACTPKKWQSFELGGAFQYGWDDKSLATVGPSLKLNLRSIDSGLGIAASASGLINVRSGRVETASLIVPVTVPVTDGTTINLNGGLSYSLPSRYRYAAFYGGQVEIQCGRGLSWMVEAFQRAHAPVGAQTGLRWTPGGGHVDFDIVLGRYIDGVNRRAVSFGLTFRS